MNGVRIATETDSPSSPPAISAEGFSSEGMAGDVEARSSRRVGMVGRDGCDLVDGWGNECDVVFSIYDLG